LAHGLPLSRCRELGVARHLIKPISPSELLEAILLALGQEPEQAPSSRVMDPPRQDRRRLGILVARTTSSTSCS
jgi:hypothetical protein